MLFFGEFSLRHNNCLQIWTEVKAALSDEHGIAIAPGGVNQLPHFGKVGTMSEQSTYLIS
jgi:hypothetical protein